MNTNILNKCIEELKKDTPDLSYLRGMLETLMEMQNEPLVTKVYKDLITPTAYKTTPVPATNLDEAAILDARARQAIEAIKLTETTEQ